MTSCVSLLLDCRDLRAQVEDQHLQSVVLGPSEESLQLSESELSSKQQRHVSQLSRQLQQARAELQAISTRVVTLNCRAALVDIVVVH